MKSLPLHAWHAERQARFSEWNGHEMVASYGDGSPAEYEAARKGCALVDFSARELLRVTGPDRVSFLHGMVTQDIEGLPERGVAYAAMLTAKGAMVADARVYRDVEALWLELEPGVGAAGRAFLEKYLISEDAEVHEATEQLASLSLLGPEAAALVARAFAAGDAPPPGTFVQTPAQQFIAPSHLPGVEGVDLIVPRASLQTVFDSLVGAGATPAGVDAYEVVRVEAGVPRFLQDMETTTIPLEANLDRALNYKKGCYIGQEVIARATFRGHMNRKLTGLLLGESTPARKTELRNADKRVGWLTSVVRSPAMNQNVALGYVYRDLLEPGTRLELAGAAEGATVHGLPFWQSVRP